MARRRHRQRRLTSHRDYTQLVVARMAPLDRWDFTLGMEKHG